MANRVEITVQATDKGAKAVISGVSDEAVKAKPALKSMSDSLDQVGKSAQTTAPAVAKVGKEVHESANDSEKAAAMFARLDGQMKDTAAASQQAVTGIDQTTTATTKTQPALSKMSDGLRVSTGGLKDFGRGAAEAAGDALGLPPAITSGAATLGILGAALALGVGAFIAWRKSQEDARKRQEELRNTLDDVTAAITDQTRAMAAKKLQDQGALDAAQRLGIATDRAVDAALGNKDAIQEVTDAQAKHNKILIDKMGVEAAASNMEYQLGDSVRQLSGDLSTAQGDAEQMRDAIYGVGQEADAAAKFTNDMATAIGEYDAAVRRTTDPVFALQDALANVAIKQKAYNDAVATYGANSTEAAAAAWDLTNATTDAQSAANNGDLSFEAFNASLDNMYQKGLITAEQLRVMKEQAANLNIETDKFADPKIVDVRAQMNADSVKATQDAINNLLKARTLQINPAVRSVAIPGGTMSARATGGVVGSAATGGARSGLTRVGEQGEELLDLPPGTQVHSNPDTERMTNQQGGGGVVQVVFGSDGSQLGDLILALVRNTVRVRGGNVQTVLGA